MQTMFPDFCFRIWRMAYLEQRNGPFRLTPRTKSQSSSVVSGTAFSTWTPALLMRMSIRPNRVTVASIRLRASAAEETLVLT